MGGGGHPGGDCLVHALFEGSAEGAVAAIAALGGELLGGEWVAVGDGLAIESDEMVDAEIVDVGAVVDALL